MARVPASERTRNALKHMFAGKTAADKSSLVRQAARLIVEEALESEAVEALKALAPGTKEDTASCRDFLRDLKSRGLVDPILGVTRWRAGADSRP